MQAQIDEIALRWEDNMESVCESCMYEAIRHWDRNAECSNDDENVNHPDRYDGDLYANAGADIKCLLDIIKTLMEQ